jgi:hypothetical protein
MNPKLQTNADKVPNNNHTLAGLRRLGCYSILAKNVEDIILSKEDIDPVLQRRLRSAGLTVLENGKERSEPGRPYIVTLIEKQTLNETVGNLRWSIITVDIQVYQDVMLTRNKGKTFPAIVWQSNTHSTTYGDGLEPAVVKRLLLRSVEATLEEFITCYRSVNRMR